MRQLKDHQISSNKLFNLENEIAQARGTYFSLKDAMAAIQTGGSTIPADIETRIVTAETDIDNLNTQVGSLDQKVTANETSISTLQSGQDDFDSRVTTAEGELGSLDTRVGIAETKIGSLEATIGDSDIRLTAAEGEITSLKTTDTDLDARLSTVETEINAIQGDNTTQMLDTRLTAAEGEIINLKTADTNFNTRLGAVESKVTTAENNINSLQSSNSSLSNKVDTIESNISTLNTKLTAAETNITNNQTSITDHETRLTDTETNVTDITTEITTARGDKQTLKEYIDSRSEQAGQVEFFRIKEITYDGSQLVVSINKGHAFINGMLVYSDLDQSHNITAPTVGTTWLIFLKQDGTFFHTTEVGVDYSDSILLGEVTTGTTLEELSFKDYRPVLNKDATIAEIRSAKQGFATLRDRLDIESGNFDHDEETTYRTDGQVDSVTWYDTEGYAIRVIAHGYGASDQREVTQIIEGGRTINKYYFYNTDKLYYTMVRVSYV